MHLRYTNSQNSALFAFVVNYRRKETMKPNLASRLTFLSFLTLITIVEVAWGVMMEPIGLEIDTPNGQWYTYEVYLPVTTEDEDSVYTGPLSVYPSPDWYSALVNTSVDSFSFDPRLSLTANATGGGDDFSPYVYSSNPLGTAGGASIAAGDAYVEFFALETGASFSNVSVKFIAADAWDLTTKNGSKYPQTAGILGLGPFPVRRQAETGTPPGFIQQLKDRGEVESNFYGLHIGVPSLGLRSSLALGGYDKSRALGTPAVFDLYFNSEQIQLYPSIFLINLTIGVEVGGSPFNIANVSSDSPVSIWQDIGEDGASAVEAVGGPTGSALVLFTTSIPYITLPIGTCNAIAQYLPVTWQETIGHWIWDTDDAAFERIVNSPAYLGFTFSDRDANDVTIKVPMKLLNLTLQSPIVASPMQYFPCQEVEFADSGCWELGRAFLQAAFVGYNYEQSLIYLAQAPGPDIKQKMLREFGVDDQIIETNSADSFRTTWERNWTILEESTREERGGTSGGLSTAHISGIVVGGVMALGLIALAIFFWHHRQKARDKKKVPSANLSVADPQEVESSEQPQELNVHERPQELRVQENPQELPASGSVHESSERDAVHEVDGGSVHRAA